MGDVDQTEGVNVTKGVNQMGVVDWMGGVDKREEADQMGGVDWMEIIIKTITRASHNRKLCFRACIFFLIFSTSSQGNLPHKIFIFKISGALQ